MHCAILIGVGKGRVGVLLCRRAVGVGGLRVVSGVLCHSALGGTGSCGCSLVPLCRGDWCAARNVRCAVPL